MQCKAPRDMSLCVQPSIRVRPVFAVLLCNKSVTLPGLGFLPPEYILLVATRTIRHYIPCGGGIRCPQTERRPVKVFPCTLFRVQDFLPSTSSGEVSFSDVLLVGGRMRTSSSTTTRIDVVLVTRDSPEDEGAGWKNKKVCLCELLTR